MVSDERFVYVDEFQILVSGHHDQAALLGCGIIEFTVLGLDGGRKWHGFDDE